MANYKKASVIVLANADGTQSIPTASSAQRLTWLETTDQINYADTVSVFNGHTFTAPYTGFYQVSVSLWFGSAVTLTAGFVNLVKNSDLSTSLLLTNGAQPTGAVQQATRTIRLAQGDTVAIFCAQTSGSSQTLDVRSSTLSIVRVGNAS